MDLYEMVRRYNEKIPGAYFGPRSLSHSEWVKIFQMLGQWKRSVMFYIGDAMLACERQHGERAAQLLEGAGLSESEKEDAVRLSERWREEDRVYGVPWTMHRDAGLDMGIATRIVKSARDLGWSREQLREARKILESVLAAGAAEQEEAIKYPMEGK